MSLDAEWLEFTLLQDAQHIAGLAMAGDEDACQAFIRDSHYEERFAQWKAIR